MSRNYVALDIETTGLRPEQDEIIEIGAVRYQDGMAVETYSSLIKPNARISSRITEITGITNAMVQEERSCEEVLPEFLAFLGADIMIGHNVRFDYSFLKVHAYRQKMNLDNKAIDTLYLAKKLHPEFESRSLGAMCSQYGIINEHAHRAFDDAKACAELYEMMYKQFGESMQEVFLAKPIAYKIKKEESITSKQKIYLNDLTKYHKINLEMPIDSLTKSDASRLIDKIILNYGRIMF
ncbi:3'-5' exonuclease [Anaerosporobacter sp.]|uniref:3'-5' exonuclease n=1 Tax=Anaerosporobacter sp. TaxID=1872529 RepID=UPI002F40B088